MSNNNTTTKTTHHFTKQSWNDTAVEGFTMSGESGMRHTTLRFGSHAGEAFAFAGGVMISDSHVEPTPVAGDAKVGDLFEMNGETFEMTFFHHRGGFVEPTVRFEKVS